MTEVKFVDRTREVGFILRSHGYVIMVNLSEVCDAGARQETLTSAEGIRWFR